MGLGENESSSCAEKAFFLNNYKVFEPNDSESQNNMGAMAFFLIFLIKMGEFHGTFMMLSSDIIGNEM